MTSFCACGDRNPLHCFLPDYILDQLQNDPDPAVRESALRTKVASTAFRVQRAALVPQFRALANARASLGGSHAADESIPAPNISLFNGGGVSNLPGSPIPNPGNDPASQEAHDGLLATHKFYAEVFKRNSIDNNGLTLRATVHHSPFNNGKYDNAFWSGPPLLPFPMMVFGDGDVLFKRMTLSLDVIGHELAHGVTDFSGGLVYQFQHGAVNESYSDVFGSMVKQFDLNQTADQADWLLGKELMKSAPCMRSLKDPHDGFGMTFGGLKGQPRHMSEFENLTLNQDNGGVHINSGIPNHAFYTAATLLGGHAWTTAGRVWYEVLTATSDTISSTCSFQEFADFTIKYAIKLANPDGGRDGRAHTAITLGWKKVGIVVATPSTKTTMERRTDPTDDLTALTAKLKAAKQKLTTLSGDAKAAADAIGTV